MRQRLIALGVFALIIAGLVVLLLTVLRDDEGETPPLEQEALFDAAEGDVVISLEVTNNETGQTFNTRFEGEDWAVIEVPEGADTDLPLNTLRIGNAAITLLSLQPSRTLSELESLAPFGLDSAGYTINFRTAGGRQYTLYVGDLNPAGTAYYVQRPGDEMLVYLVNSFSMGAVLGLVDDPPFVTPTPEPGAEEDAELTPTTISAEGEGDLTPTP